jgi:hypothetical protein
MKYVHECMGDIERAESTIFTTGSHIRFLADAPSFRFYLKTALTIPGFE